MRVKLMDEIEPILMQIRSEAAKSYDRFLTSIPDKDLHPEVWAKDRTEFFGTVDDLLTRFRQYYDLDAHDFSVNVTQLATPSDAKDDRKHGGPLVSGRPMGGTTFANIFSADDNYMQEVAEMIHAEQWNSPSAIAFRDNFLRPFEHATQWQGAYVKELAIAATAYALAVSRAKTGLKFVAESCLGALRGRPMYQGNLKFTGEDPKAVPFATAAGVISTVLTAIGIFASGGAAIIIGSASLASGLYSFGKQGGDEPYLEVSYSDSPQSVIRQTGYALANLLEWILGEDDAIAGGLDKDLSSDVAFASPKLKLPPPGVNSGTYKDLDIKDADGKPPNQVVVSVVQLGKAGSWNLPGAAHELDLAVQRLDACQIPGSMSRFFPRSIRSFNTSIDQLADILRDTRDGLIRAGDAMLTSARNYAGTDEERAEIIRQISQVPPHHSNAPVH